MVRSLRNLAGPQNSLAQAGGAGVEFLPGPSPIVKSSFASPGNVTRGLTFDGTSLISCDTGSNLIYVHDGISSTILSSFATPGTSPTGLTFDGANLISGDANSDLIYVHENDPEFFIFRKEQRYVRG